VKTKDNVMSEDRKTKEEFLASRKAAGQVIDVETCRIGKLACNVVDPYGLDRDAESCIGNLLFVVSAETDGWVLAEDLPEEKYNALYARIDRARQTPTTAEGVRDILLEEYARAVAALDDVVEDVVDSRFNKVPVDIVRSGIRLALAKLGKQGTSQEERLERRFGAGLESGNEVQS
jgi:hypothetical protein